MSVQLFTFSLSDSDFSSDSEADLDLNISDTEGPEGESILLLNKMNLRCQETYCVQTLSTISPKQCPLNGFWPRRHQSLTKNTPRKDFGGLGTSSTGRSSKNHNVVQKPARRSAGAKHTALVSFRSSRSKRFVMTVASLIRLPNISSEILSSRAPWFVRRCRKVLFESSLVVAGRKFRRVKYVFELIGR